MGRIKGDNVECRYHGMTFDPSGACVHIPGRRRSRPAPASEAIRWSNATTGSGSGWATRHSPIRI
jgi:phenylpropionate dioxygenase-like ring-hydroxylating dioxygenase large terminal subunit